jgi:hypothetical protein
MGTKDPVKAELETVRESRRTSYPGDYRVSGKKCGQRSREGRRALRKRVG